ncbi:MAG: cupin domain-containing protein [Bacteroidales bacterium]|nr:cupin domain-containing protein [Bacteroidales bacterium]
MRRRIFRLVMPLAMMTLAFTGCRNANKNVEQTPVPEAVTDKIPETIPQKVISTIDFNSMEVDTMSNFKGGDGDIYMKMLVDGKNKFMYCTIPSGSSVGNHTHETDLEIVYVLQGEASIVFDGVEQVYTKGMAHYCQKGHGHSINNKNEEDLVTFNVVAPQ